jgi:hypothetical protein
MPVMRDLNSKSAFQVPGKCPLGGTQARNAFMRLSPKSARYERFEFEKCLPSAWKVPTWMNLKRVHASDPEKCPLSSGVMRL